MSQNHGSKLCNTMTDSITRKFHCLQILEQTPPQQGKRSKGKGREEKALENKSKKQESWLPRLEIPPWYHRIHMH